MAQNVLTNLSLQAIPTDPSHVVNIQFVTDYVAGKVKMPVRAVATANQGGTMAGLVFTYTATGALNIDGVNLVVGDRVLLAGQTDGTQNGIYTVTGAGDGTTAAEITRASDFETSAQIYSGLTVSVNEGTLYADTTWKLITDGTITLGSTALDFINVQAAVGTKKFAATITGDGTATSFPVNHNLGTTDVIVSVVDLASNAVVTTDVGITDNNNVAIGFSAAPASSDTYRVIVIG